MSHTSRRTFLKTTGAAAAVAMTGAARLAAKPMKKPLGLQLYSVRDQLPTDFAGTLAKVHADGYTVVEAAGYYDRTAKDFRKAMDNAGLRCVSTHHALNVLETSWTSGSNTGRRWGLNTSSVRRRAGCIATRRRRDRRRWTTGTGLPASSTGLARR